MKNTFYLLVILLLFNSCINSNKKLPILGNPKIINNDTIYPAIKPFSFLSQDSTKITNETFYNKIYIADFIFLSCPTICPKMTNELLKVYKKYQRNDNILFLSHTIDPERDSVKRLKKYSTDLGINTKKWFFVTGNKDSIYDTATKSYFTTAYKDSKEPGGYVHGGGLLLIDKNKNIRGVYDGTNPVETKRLIKDLDKLLKEQF